MKGKSSKMNEDTQARTKSKEFSKLQQIFWPIYGYELKKFLPMSMLMFCILFVYAMVRNLKDTFIQHYAICGGTELMPILKLFFVMPAAFFAVILFTFFINKFGSTKTFYIMISLFVLFYTVFLFILLPNVNILHANEATVRHLQESLPNFLHYTIPCFTNWCYTLFYVVSETWSTIALSSLFWQFANRITKESEAKRFYALYSLISSIGVILSGGVLSAMSKAGGAEFERNVRILISLCILFAVTTMVIFYYINAVIVPDPKYCDPVQFRLPSKKMHKKDIDVFEGIKMLIKEPYIALMALLVLTYGISDNLLETVWKAQLRYAVPDPSSYAAMMGFQSIIVGFLTICITILSTYMLRKLSWKFCAGVTPITMLLLGLMFFGLVCYSNGGHQNLYGIPIDVASAWIGLVVVALVRSTKYSLFDATKNMAYRPLDVDTKTKGQAAVEIIAGRGGKSGAALINVFLTNILAVGSKIFAHLYTIIPIFMLTVVGWIISVFRLSPQYHEKLSKQNTTSS